MAAGVICLWEYVAPTSPCVVGTWKLSHSYAVDNDGHAIEMQEHYEDNWLYDEEADEHIPGRLITDWSMDGVSLREFIPPSNVGWLSHFFSNQLKKSKKWYEFLSGGLNLYLGTQKEASKYLAEIKY